MPDVIYSHWVRITSYLQYFVIYSLSIFHFFMLPLSFATKSKHSKYLLNDSEDAFLEISLWARRKSLSEISFSSEEISVKGDFRIIQHLYLSFSSMCKRSSSWEKAKYTFERSVQKWNHSDLMKIVKTNYSK